MRYVFLSLLMMSGHLFAVQGTVEVGIRTYNYRVGECSIEQWTWTSSSTGDTTNWKVGKGCTEKDITWIEKKVRESEQHDDFVSEIGAYFGEMPLATETGGQGIPNGAAYTGVAWAGNDGTGDFAMTFGTPFDSSKLGTTRRGGVFLSGDEGETREKMIRSGAAVVYALATTDLGAALSEGGQRVGIAWHAVLHGGPPDLLSQAQLKAVHSYQVQQIQSFQEAVVRQVGRMEAAEKDLVIGSSLVQLDSKLSLSSAVKHFTSASKRIEQSVAEFKALPSQVTTLTKIRADQLHLPDTEIANLRAGKIPSAELEAMRSNLADKMATGNVAASLPALNAMMKLAREDQNPFRREQLENLTKGFIDDRGLVASWAAVDKTVQAIKLQSGRDTKAGRLVRENLNEAMGFKQSSGDPKVCRRTDVAMSLLQIADGEFAAGRTARGARELERGRVLLDYLTNHPRLQQYATHSLSPAAQAVFGVQAQATSFEEHQIVDLGERLMAAGNLDSPAADPDILFQAVTTIQQMKWISSGGDNLIGFIQLTETGNDLVDQLLGATGYLRRTVIETVTGIQTMVNHPAETAEAIYHAVRDYEKTYHAIAKTVEDKIDAYPTMSAAEKGALHAQVVTELIGVFTAVGAIKNLGTTVRMATGLAKAGAQLTGDVVTGMRGARRVATLAPELLDAVPFSTHNLQMGRALLDAPESFISDLSDYMEVTQLSRKEASWLARFREGGSYFTTKDNYLKWVEGGGSTIGTLDGQYVIPKKLADWVQSSAGGSAKVYRDALGWPELASGTELYRVDLPFKFEYSPQMPLGLEASTNAMFTGTGYTSGGLPEIVLYQPPKTDIVWKGLVGTVQ